MDHSKIGLLGTMIFLGWMVSSMIVPGLSDIYGRKKFFVFFLIAQILSIFALNSSSTLSQALLSLFCFGFSGVGRSPLAYIYMQEMLTPAYQKVAGPIFSISCAACLFIGTVLF